MLKSYNPFNNQVLREYQITSKQKLDEILLNTKEAREEWLNKDINQRSIAISKLSESIITNLDEIATNIVSETGIPISEAKSSTKKLVNRIDFLCEKTPLFLEPEIHDLKDGRTNMITYNSIGTVSCIMPWNHPFILPFWSIVPALIAGNSVIYKPSELTPLVGETISKLFST
jgi:acyl-CoA reductase-like NAD-dependent aldehyde dehydrogenase